MAALLLSANSGDQAVAGTVAKTILQITAPANQRVKIQGFSITLAGTTPLDLIVRVLRQTTSGTGNTTVTPVKLDPTGSETIQTTVATNFSAEPTAGNVLEYKRLQGSFEKMYLFGQELIVPGGGRVGIEVTCTINATVAAEFRFEE